MLLLLPFGFPMPARGAGADTHPDWARVERAQDRLARRDFRGAVKALAEVDPEGEAALVAEQVRQQLDRAMAGHVEVEAVGFSDTQPLSWSRFRASGRGWVMPSLEVELEGASQLVETVVPDAPSGQMQGAASANWTLFDANLWLDGTAGLARWTDGAVVFFGQAGAEARWLSPLRVSLRLAQDQVTVTEDSLRAHVLSTTGTASARLEDLAGWYAELLYSRRHYSDDNAEDAAYLWFLAPILREPLRLGAGYAGAYGNTAATRWNFVTQRYTPYFSPLDQWRHGPLATVGMTVKPVSLDVKGTLAWVDEREPNAEAWGVEGRRKWLFGNVEAALGVALRSCSVKAAYQYEHQIYYQYHQARLSVDVPLD